MMNEKIFDERRDHSNDERRLYSLNLMATLITLVPDLQLQLKYDEESRTYYGTFDSTPETDEIIKRYRNDTLTLNIKDFLKSMKKLRTAMHAI